MASKIKLKSDRMRRPRSNTDTDVRTRVSLNRFDETDSALPPVVRARLYELFSQIEKELENVYTQNLALQEKVEGLTERMDIGQDGQEIPDVASIKAKRGHQISQKLKTTYRLASTSKLVSSFRTSPSPFSLVHEYRGHHDGVWEVGVMSTGDLIATASADHTVRVWCANSGACLLHYTGHSGSVNSVRFHPVQCDLALTASGDQHAHIWKAHVVLPSESFKTHSSGEDDLEGSEKEDGPDETTESNEATLVKAPLKEFDGHTSVISAADWMMGGGQVITASWDRTAILFDVESGEQISTLTGHDEELTELRSHPSQRLVVTCSKDTTFRLWDMRDAAMKVNVFQGHTQPVTTAVFVGGDKITSGSDDRTVKVWDLRNMRSPLTTIRTDSAVNRLAVSDLQNLMAIPHDNRHVRIYDVNGTRLGRLPRSNRQGHSRMVCSVAWADSNSRCNLFTCGFDRQVFGWHVTNPHKD